jgi:hypothetical protein
MSGVDWSRVVKVGLEVGNSISRSVMTAIALGEPSALESLRSVVHEPSALTALDEALRLAQRAKAAGVLRP